MLPGEELKIKVQLLSFVLRPSNVSLYQVDLVAGFSRSEIRVIPQNPVIDYGPILDLIRTVFGSRKRGRSHGSRP